MSKIVIIEDEKSIRDELCLLLTNAGYEVVVTEDFNDTASWVLAQSPDLILLDVGLPLPDGYDKKQSHSNTPQQQAAGYLNVISSFVF